MTEPLGNIWQASFAYEAGSSFVLRRTGSHEITVGALGEPAEFGLRTITENGHPFEFDHSGTAVVCYNARESAVRIVVEKWTELGVGSLLSDLGGNRPGMYMFDTSVLIDEDECHPGRYRVHDPFAMLREFKDMAVSRRLFSIPDMWDDLLASNNYSFPEDGVLIFNATDPSVVYLEDVLRTMMSGDVPVVLCSNYHEDAGFMIPASRYALMPETWSASYLAAQYEEDGPLVTEGNISLRLRDSGFAYDEVEGAFYYFRSVEWGSSSRTTLVLPGATRQKKYSRPRNISVAGACLDANGNKSVEIRFWVEPDAYDVKALICSAGVTDEEFLAITDDNASWINAKPVLGPYGYSAILPLSESGTYRFAVHTEGESIIEDWMEAEVVAYGEESPESDPAGVSVRPRSMSSVK